METNDSISLLQQPDSSLVSTDTSYNKFHRFIHSFYSDVVEKFQKSKVFPIPFLCTEDLLKKIEKEVMEIMENLTGPERHNPIEFESLTRFQDLSILKMDSFTTFLDKAGNKKNDPELARLIWKYFYVNGDGTVTAGQVKIFFKTEKVLHTQDLDIGEFNRASMVIDITGSDSNWVENAFERLTPFIDSAKLSGIYKPLWFFRNKVMVSITSYLTGSMGLFIGINTASQILRDKHNTNADYLKRLNTAVGAEQKIDILAQYFFSPTKSLWYEPIITMGCGALSYVLIYFSSMYLLPKLTPSSHIAIGLANLRASRHMNTFKFIIFTILVGGIIVPLIFKLIFG